MHDMQTMMSVRWWMRLAPVLISGSLVLAVEAAPSEDPLEPLRQRMEAIQKQGREARSQVLGLQLRSHWSTDGQSLVFRKESPSGHWHFLRLDLASGKVAPAFDAASLAKALEQAGHGKFSPEQLPLDWLSWDVASDSLTFLIQGKSLNYQPGNGQLREVEPVGMLAELKAPSELRRYSGSGDESTAFTLQNATAQPVELFWCNHSGQPESYGSVAAGASREVSTRVGHVWLVRDAQGKELAGFEAADEPQVARITGKVEPTRTQATDPGVSPDGKWRAEIRQGNLVAVSTRGGEAIPLSTDADGTRSYAPPFAWSPDSRKVVAMRITPVKTRKVHIVQSSPPDQLQPELLTLDYPKPGDPLPAPKPCLFDVAARRAIPVSDALFTNPWEISDLAWEADSSAFSFGYNQRGHQLVRLLAVDAVSGAVRVIHEERSKTFIDYAHKWYLHRLATPSAGWIWATEASGYNHLVLIDPVSGRVKKPLTQGNWNVREVVEVDEEKGRLLARINGQDGSDPYHNHFAWVALDGSGLTRMTHSDGNHRIRFSPDRRHVIDTWSRVDQPPVTEVRRSQDGSLVAEIHRADDSALQASGWTRPERFSAKGRDGKTDIFGIIVRPTRFDPARRYPVVEDIYAGPHDFFVPKSYQAWSRMQAMAELGFVVVKIDGMGTNWRSKAFHDVCWKNIADGGFPDRIAWLRAAAASRPWMDLERLGIYGGSAGGQNALAALLHHGDVYRAAVADCGCHDNRMDKVWWNEAWMGWPVDESYARNSNVENAGKLRGKLMLIVGEVDRNVDPASTAQVVAALQRAGKYHEFVPIMNADHGAAETPYGSLRRAEFLMRSLAAQTR